MDMRKYIKYVTETIGVLQIIAFLILIPVLTGFIANIWNALSLNQRIIAVICIVFILVSIGLFIYGQMRKPLYIIPQLLNQMRCRVEALVQDLQVESDQYLKMLSLLNIQVPEEINQMFNETSPILEKLEGLNIVMVLFMSQIAGQFGWRRDHLRILKV